MNDSKRFQRRIKKAEAEINKIAEEHYDASEKVKAALQRYYKDVYGKSVGTTYMDYLQRVPHRDKLSQDQTNDGVFSFLPERYSFEDYIEGKVTLFEYAKDLAEYGIFIDFKADPDWRLVFTMQTILLGMESDPQKRGCAMLIKAFRNYLNDSELVKIIRAYFAKKGFNVCPNECGLDDLESVCFKFIRSYLLKNGVYFCRNEKEQIKLVKAACKHHWQFSEWISKRKAKGVPYPDFSECDDLDSVQDKWQEFSKYSGVLSQEDREKMRRYHRSTVYAINIKNELKYS